MTSYNPSWGHSIGQSLTSVYKHMNSIRAWSDVWQVNNDDYVARILKGDSKPPTGSSKKEREHSSDKRRRVGSILKYLVCVKKNSLLSYTKLVKGMKWIFGVVCEMKGVGSEPDI